MKKTQNMLMIVYMALIVIGIIVVVLFETDLLESGVLADDKQSEFLFTTLMELLTLGCAFLALRLFKFEKVHQELISKEAHALKKWGLTRLILLLVPMLVNTLLYYIYMNTTFGYLAIILLLCLPFVFPSMNRCLAETKA